MGKKRSKRYVRPSLDDNHYQKTSDRWLIGGSCLARLLLLLALGGATIWLAARWGPGPLANTDPEAGAAAMVIIGILGYLVTRISTDIRLVVVEHLQLSRDVEMDMLRQRLIETYCQDHPPNTLQELKELLDEVHRSELHRIERTKQYRQNIDRDARLWNRLVDWLIHHHLERNPASP